MLRKLVEISLGRQGRTTDTGLPAESRGSNAHAMFSSTSRNTLAQPESQDTNRAMSTNLASIKSMHIGRRKRELLRIEQENAKIAQKIFSIQPHHSARNDQKDYAKSKKVIHNLQKIKKKSYEGGLVLPPIRNTNTVTSQYSPEMQSSPKSDVKYMTPIKSTTSPTNSLRPED